MAEHKKTEPVRIFFRYVFEFTAAGFAGWLYEVATVWVMYHYFSNRGMLHLPIVPIYAVGAFILLALLRKKRNPVFIFFFAMAVTTVFEIGASYLLEFIFHEEFWTYENWYFSILDRSSLISSAIFGILAVGYFYLLHPLSGKLSEKLPKGVCAAAAAIMSAVILGDMVISFSQHLKN
ncbi:putative ABC transporter permease [Ruminococcus sp.]|uniref:putative ABC transporter permease n=1 Tax=Ruminococcus sp. TaxID=41978 RepID=UPI002BC268BB|nr:putative ABC transporter permease [Ruminococcus sp.]HNZ98911.1 putative ABC transporter permease [Ruminococcus sp.]HOH86551.1 putative ABC transporter permease [Ruminococcus sp.]